MKKAVKDLTNWQSRLVCYVLRNRVRVPGITDLEKITNTLRASCGIPTMPFHGVFTAVYEAGIELLSSQQMAKLVLESTDEEIMSFYRANPNSSVSMEKLLDNVLSAIQTKPLDFEGCVSDNAKIQRYVDSFNFEG